MSKFLGQKFTGLSFVICFMYLKYKWLLILLVEV